MVPRKIRELAFNSESGPSYKSGASAKEIP